MKRLSGPGGSRWSRAFSLFRGRAANALAAAGRKPVFFAAVAGGLGLALCAGSAWLDRQHSLQEIDPSRRGPGARLERFDLLRRLELTLFDFRANFAARRAPPLSSELRLVALSDRTSSALLSGYFVQERYGMLYPRLLFGEVLQELANRGVKAVAFDVLMPDERPDHPKINWTAAGKAPEPISSDQYFARALGQFGRAIVGADIDAPPALPFRQAAAALGGTDSPRDIDGAARRAYAFRDCVYVSTNLVQYAADQDLVIEHGSAGRTDWSLVDYSRETPLIILIADRLTNGLFQPFEKGAAPFPAFVTNRVWHLGIALAAMRDGLDLDRARITLGDRIELTSPDGRPPVRRSIPIDDFGAMVVDWTVSVTNLSSLRPQPLALFEDLVRTHIDRAARTNAPPADDWRDALVVVGSLASGNNLTDTGPTPLQTKDFLVGTHLNVANGLLQDRFIRRTPLWIELGLVLAMSLAGAGATSRWAPPVAAAAVGGAGVAYGALALWAYVALRWWIPVAHPLVAGLLLSHAALLSWRAVFEQNERKRVRSVFARIVAPEVVHELLGAERLSLGGARRRLTVFFADVRGFTEMTDQQQAAAEDRARLEGLTGAAADAFFEQQAGEVLATVNLYLGAIADLVKSHHGTLDKYIGDCVMAFWGAPTNDENHAVLAVRTAIGAQRAIARLNHERALENERRASENAGREAAGQRPLEMLPILQLGSGINTGLMTVGLMGSDAHILNYTVFGREVNLASRLEGVSGRGRIIIGPGTFEDLQRLAPDLAAECRTLEAVSVKGFRQPVPIFEVPWGDNDATGDDSAQAEITANRPAPNPPASPGRRSAATRRAGRG